MGRRGPAPKPTSVKRAQGNPGKRRLSDDEPVPPAGEIAVPSWLGVKARKVWHEIAPVAIAMKTLTVADVEAFAHHADSIAQLRECRRWVDKHGAEYEVETEDGRLKSVREHPRSIRLRALAKIVQAGDDRFGLNPAGRTRIKVERGASGAAAAPVAPAASPFREKFLGGGPIPISKGA